METFSITKFVPEFLKDHPDERFKAREIAEWIVAHHPDAIEAKRRKSKASKLPLDTDAAMIQQIVAEIGAQRPSLESKYGIRTTDGRPRKYYFTSRSVEEEADSDTINNDFEVAPSGNVDPVPSTKLSEHDLYPLLREYLRSELNVYSKRIDEKKSVNNKGAGGNKWLYPDIVGVEDLTQNWPAEIIACAREHGNKRSKLWSFEVKLRLNPANVRESYFQAVSNSLWANYAYLVAAEIQNALPELRVLASLHGVGVIELNVDEPNESTIVLPARERDEVDWGSVNRIFQQNSDFQDYIQLVKSSDQTGQYHPKLWD